ncbi:MAG TPA: hypothetical protein VIL07_02245 [Symbiobacteriaceae bacterium]
MDTTRRKGRDDWRETFEVIEKDGTESFQDMLLDTVADYLNAKYGQEVVVRRGRGSAG